MITTIARPKAPPVSSCSRKETNLSGVNYFFLSATIRIPHQRQLDLGPLSPCLCLLIFLSACAGRCFPVLAGFVCSLAAPGAKACDARRAERLGRSAWRGQ